MNSTNKILSVLFLTFIISCDSSSKVITHTWKVNRFEVDENGKSNISSNLTIASGLKDSFLKFYPDGSLINWNPEKGYSLGRWKTYSEDNVYELLGEGFGKSFKIKLLKKEDEQAKFVVLENKNESAITLFFAENHRYEFEDVDLLEPRRNTWRIKPVRPESDKAIKKRCLDMVTFIIDYFEAINKTEQGYFETPILQSPFTFYSGGMGLANPENLPTEWEKTFHNHNDAVKAQKLLSDAFDEHGEYPSGLKTHTEGYIKFLKGVKFNLE